MRFLLFANSFDPGVYAKKAVNLILPFRIVFSTTMSSLPLSACTEHSAYFKFLSGQLMTFNKHSIAFFLVFKTSVRSKRCYGVTVVKKYRQPCTVYERIGLQRSICIVVLLFLSNNLPFAGTLQLFESTNTLHLGLFELDLFLRPHLGWSITFATDLLLRSPNRRCHTFLLFSPLASSSLSPIGISLTSVWFLLGSMVSIT